MKALAAAFDIIPGWMWALLLAGALSFGLVKEHQRLGLRAQLAEARTDLANYRATAAESARLAERAERAKEARTADLQRKALDDAFTKQQATERDAAAARDAHARLLRQLAATAAAARAAGDRAAAAERRAAAGDPIRVLADVLGRCSQRVTVLAEFADRSRVAGQLCERSYDALTAAP